MLDRIGDEIARATSIVRYAPRSQFSPHHHGGGEEVLVLEGVFQDEHGDYPAGSYIRNPPTSRHTPGSAHGCVIFVKLWQFDTADRTPIRIDTHKMPFVPIPEQRGAEIAPLFFDGRENVRLLRYAPNTNFALTASGGIELLVLEGGFDEAKSNFSPQSWLRLPPGAALNATTGEHGVKLWVKSGHLAHAQIAPSESSIARG